MWLDVFKNFNENDPVIIFMGYGKLEGVIKKHQAKGSNIFYQNTVPPEVILDYSSSADIGVCCLEGDSTESKRLALPNKLFEYMMARLPVIVSNGPEMVSVIKGHKAGFILAKNTTADAIKLIKEIQNIDLTVFNKNLSKASLLFNWENQSIVLKELYNNIDKQVE